MNFQPALISVRTLLVHSDRHGRSSFCPKPLPNRNNDPDVGENTFGPLQAFHHLTERRLSWTSPPLTMKP